MPLGSPIDTLIIEDHESTREIIAKVCEIRGHKVFGFPDAESAREAVEQRHFPVIISDWMLPGISGLEFCKDIRDHCNGVDSYVLVCTARQDAGDLQKVLESGADDYVSKPFDIDDLDLRLQIAEQHARWRAEKRDAVAARMQSEQRARAAVEASFDGVFILNAVNGSGAADFEIADANARGLRMLNQPREKVIGQRSAALFPERLLQRFTAVHQSAQGLEEELEVQSPRLEAAWVSLQIVPLPGGLAVTLRDISQRKSLDDERRRLEANHARLQRLESLSVLAGGVAHDFNNILTIILGNADMALGAVPADGPVAKRLNNIRTATDRALLLTQQMATYTGNFQSKHEPLDVSMVATKTVAALQFSVPPTATLSLEAQSNLPPIRGSADQIKQLLTNLITNALEALPDSKGSVTVRTGTLHADRAFLGSTVVDENLPEGEYVHMDVVDTGAGMDEATRSHILEPFFSTKFPGRGLGLAAVLGIVRKHHGGIIIQSQPGAGSTFKVIFPALQA